MRSRLVAFLTVGMLALGTGSAVAGFSSSGGGLSGSSGERQRRLPGVQKPPCKDHEHFGDDHKCHKDDGRDHHWQHEHGWCWLEDGHGGFKWGYGDGWVYG